MGRRVAHDREQKKRWTDWEDAILTKYVLKNGSKNWNLVPSKTELQRSGKSCRQRWKHCLDPKLNKTPFDESEKACIIEFQRVRGNKWSKCAKLLPGRSDNQIKNWWNTFGTRQAASSMEDIAAECSVSAEGNFIEPPDTISATVKQLPDFFVDITKLPDLADGNILVKVNQLPDNIDGGFFAGLEDITELPDLSDGD